MKRAVAGLVLAGALLGAWVFQSIGNWLVIEDPLQPARAIAVLGGKMPFRAQEAVALYNAGYAREIWIPGPEGAAEHDPVKRMGLSPFEPDLYRKVLEKLGVPRAAVRFLSPVQVRNTREEVAVIAQALRKAGGGRVIVVTSPEHTRRVRAVWERAAWPFDELVVRYTRHEPRKMRLERWWEDSYERTAVYRECGGIVDAWLGFPARLVGR